MFQLPAPRAPRYNLFINPPHSTGGISKPTPLPQGEGGGFGGDASRAGTYIYIGAPDCSTTPQIHVHKKKQYMPPAKLLLQDVIL